MWSCGGDPHLTLAGPSGPGGPWKVVRLHDGYVWLSYGLAGWAMDRDLWRRLASGQCYQWPGASHVYVLLRGSGLGWLALRVPLGAAAARPRAMEMSAEGFTSPFERVA